MKTVITILVIALVLVGVYFGFIKKDVQAPISNEPVSTNETADWKTYTNTEYGFEFKYPQEWLIRPMTNDPNEPIITFYNEEQLWNMQVEEYPWQTSVSGNEIESMINGYKVRILDDGRDSYMSPTEGGHPGKSISFLSGREIAKGYLLQITLTMSTGLYITPTYQPRVPASPARVKELKLLLDQVASTFKFTKYSGFLIRSEGVDRGK